MSKFVKFKAQIDGYLPELSVKVDNILMVTQELLQIHYGIL